VSATTLTIGLEALTQECTADKEWSSNSGFFLLISESNTLTVIVATPSYEKRRLGFVDFMQEGYRKVCVVRFTVVAGGTDP
jgi:hypothetical protein